MTSATSLPEESSLLFRWTPPRPRARALVVFICLSFLLHAFAFYLFQVIYPPAAVLLPPPARVRFISTDTESGRALLRWVDAEDPALASATLRPPDSHARALPKVGHVPSYADARLALREPPPIAIDLRPPSVLPPGPVPAQRHPPAPVVKPVPTRIIFSEEIAALGAPEFPPARFHAASREQPEGVRFRVGVNARGETQYAFAINSSGDAGLDAQARRQLTLARFPARPDTAPGTLTWGLATIDWGGDLTFPATTSNTPAAPAPEPAASPQ